MDMGNHRGAAAIVVVLAISILVAVLALVIDGGWLYAEKERLQNGVEAAAFAAASTLSTLAPEDAEEAGRQAAKESGVPNDVAEDPEQLQISFGIYDEARNTFTEGESVRNNAVKAELTKLKRPLLFSWVGFGEEAVISATATAYLPPWGMVSLAEKGAIQLSGGEYRNGQMFAVGDIKVAADDWSPVFANVRLFATGSLLRCALKYQFGQIWKVNWDSTSPVTIAGGHPGTDRTIEVPLVTKRYFQSLKASADVVYTPGQEGSGPVFYARRNNYYYFDLSGVRAKRQTIVFDGASSPGAKVVLTPYNDSDEIPGRKPLDTRAENVTFVTNLPIEKVAKGDKGPQQSGYHLGAPGERQAIIITTQYVQNFYPAGMYVDGITFRCGGDFTITVSANDASASSPIAMRVVADGTITTSFGVPSKRPVDFAFAAPAPPNIISFVTPAQE
jgi:hypothetical protein